jgi:hypothetical protein
MESMNGLMMNMVKYGMDRSYGGFGQTFWADAQLCRNWRGKVIPFQHLAWVAVDQSLIFVLFSP